MTSTPPPSVRRIGELADATGITVRTLHYYEEIGLLSPADRTAAGHRLYGADEVERLYRICMLRQLGLPLDGVRNTLDGPADELASTISAHLADVDRRVDEQNRLRARLARLGATLDAGADPTTDLLTVLEDMSMLDSNLAKPIGVLVYRDLQSAFDHLTRVFGLGPGEFTADPDGNLVHGEIEVGSGTLWLHPESEDFSLVSPATRGDSTAMMVVIVDDVDKHHAVAHGATIRYEPIDQPYGYREYGARDSEGHLWSFMKPLAG